MASHTFESELWLPCARELVYPFFADARNLEKITPPWLRFRIITPTPIPMRVGARIDYRLRIHGFPVRWQTEITRWDPPFAFVDEQRRGPYRQWIHTHTFEEKDGGTLCRDKVVYSVPGGEFINWLVVQRDVQTIFTYRRTVLSQLFPPREKDAAR
ncbi:MAG: SRPBCC family protein [Verrucomicrobia bacterium]|nr:SRPBCC family protein [Verrucomicrobiota bacterium]